MWIWIGPSDWWTGVDLGTPDLYLIRTAAKEEWSSKELVRDVKPVGNSFDSTKLLLLIMYS